MNAKMKQIYDEAQVVGWTKELRLEYELAKGEEE